MIVFFEFIKADDATERAHVAHVNHVPTRLIWITASIVMRVVDIKRSDVGIAFLDNFDDADDAGHFASGMIKIG